MGAWGHTAFENDTALDWVEGLRKARSTNILRKALKLTDKNYSYFIESSVAEEALAAAEVVAFIAGKPLTGNIPDVVKDFGKRIVNVDDALIGMALSFSKHIFYGNSELKEMWKISEPYEKWKKYTYGLVSRLAEILSSRIVDNYHEEKKTIFPNATTQRPKNKKKRTVKKKLRNNG